MFVRFVIKQIDPDSGRRQSLFQAVDELKKSGALSTLEHERLEAIGDWFDKYLKRPARLTVSRRSHSKAQAISWFRDTATEHIAKIRELQDILQRHGVKVAMIKSKRLGYVLYEDEFQVAAYPFSDTPT